MGSALSGEDYLRVGSIKSPPFIEPTHSVARHKGANGCAEAYVLDYQFTFKTLFTTVPLSVFSTTT